MKRKKYIPLAITMLLAVPAFLTSCQEPPTLSPAAIMSRVKGWIIALCGLLAKSSGIRAEQRGEEKRKLTCNVKCHSPGVNQRKTRPQSLKRSSTGGFQGESRP